MSQMIYGTSVKHVASKERLDKAFSIQQKEKRAVFYVLPSHKWLQTARKRQPRLPMTTFDDIASFILKQANEPYLPLSEHERSLFFQQFIREENLFTEKVHDLKAKAYAETYGQVKRLGLSVEELPLTLAPLKQLFKNYEKKIVQDRHLLDPENMILRAISLLKEKPIDIGRVIIDGYFDFSSLQMLLIEGLKEANVSVDIHVPTDTNFTIVKKTVDELVGIGFEDVRAMQTPQVVSNKKEIAVATTEEEQWRGVLEEIRLCESSYEDIGILVVDERNGVEELERYSDQYGIPLNQVKKRSLTSTSIHAFVHSLLRIGHVPISKWEQLPLVEHILKLYAVNGLHYAKQKEQFLQSGLWNDEHWQHSYVYLSNLQLDKEGNFVDYLKSLEEWLVELPVVSYWEETLVSESERHLLIEIADEYKAWQKIIVHLQEYKEFLVKKGLHELKMSRDLFIDWFQEIGEQLQIFKRRALTKGVSVFSWRDIGLFTGQKLYVVGMNEGVFPHPYRLGGYVQEWDLNDVNIQFSPPTQEQSRLKQEAHFQQLDYIAPEIVYTYVIGVDAEHPLLPSSFLADLALDERKWSADQRLAQPYAFYMKDKDEKVAFHLGKGAKVDDVSKQIQMLQTRSERLSTWDETFTVALNKEHRVAVTALESYARCPFKYALDRILSIDEPRVEEENVSPLSIGDFIHEIIEEVYVELGLIGVAFASVDKERLDEVPKWLMARFEEKWLTIESEHTNISRLDLLLTKRIWQKRLLQWWDAERVHFWDNESLSEMKIKSVEKSIQLRFPLMNENELLLTGKIDRVDIEHGNFVIYDYKTGRASAKLDEVRSGLKLQLALYTLAIKKELNVTESGVADGATYISLREPKKRTTNGIWHPDNIGKGSKYKVNRNYGQGEETLGTDEFIEKYELKERIEELWSGMHENYSVKPLECSSFCSYRSICRVTDERIEESKHL